MGGHTRNLSCYSTFNMFDCLIKIKIKNAVLLCFELIGRQFCPIS